MYYGRQSRTEEKCVYRPTQNNNNTTVILRGMPNHPEESQEEDDPVTGA